MNEARFWQEKIIQLFHDPPVKVFRLFRKGGHVRCAQEWLDLFSRGKRAWLGWPGAASKHGYQTVPKKMVDRVSTGADRPVLGSRETRVDWWRHPTTLHPLDGTALEWGVGDEKQVDQDITYCLGNNAFQDWDDPSEAKTKSLWLWRCLPKRLMEKHGPIWSVLPADSRIPDHSIWDHLRMAAAYAGASNRPHFLVFAIGPVQTFIQHSRTSRDLWMGSYLLADLAWAALEPLIEQFGPDAILYPSLYGNPLADQWLKKVFPRELDDCRTLSSVLPHKFVALLPRKAVSTVGRKCV